MRLSILSAYLEASNGIGTKNLEDMDMNEVAELIFRILKQTKFRVKNLTIERRQ